MRQAQHAKSSLFLMEMMVVILFFALTSAICVHLFVQSYQSAKHSEALTNGVLQAQSTAEVYKSTAGDLGQTATLLGAAWSADKELTLAYDAHWQPTEEDAAAAYVLTMSESQGTAVPTAEVLISAADGSEVYRLSVKAYRGGGHQP